MADAKKCDRCGALYELPECTPNIRIGEYIHCYGEKRYDLCPTCQGLLEEFLKYKGE